MRLYSHVDRSRRAAFRPGARATVQLKIAKEAQRLVEKHFDDVLTFYKNSGATDKRIFLKEALSFLANIHTKVLLAVPRPHEPIELVSYLRQTLFTEEELLDNVHLSEVPEVFASEDLGDQAHERFYLDLSERSLRMRAAEAALGDLLDFAKQELESDSVVASPNSIGYISLPRIDLGNPCRWPSLLHEVGHFYYKPDDVWASFCKHIGEERLTKVIDLLASYSKETSHDSRVDELKAWLQECWCDAFAITRAGPSAFFAQMHAFLFCLPCYLAEDAKRNSKYPPAWFRLKLLLALAKGRFSSTDQKVESRIYAAMEREKRLIYKIFDVPDTPSAELFQLLHIFRDFLGTSFDRTEFQKTSSISLQLLDKLISDLKSGLPIASVGYQADGGLTAATPAEILLAGWMHRCTVYRDEFSKLVREWTESGATSSQNLLQILRAKVDRSDECLKRSIQVVEWFKILDHSSAENEKTTSKQEAFQNYPFYEDASEVPGLLSDRQLRAMLRSEDLRIIPMIDFERQVRGSVIDLRLGHNFEIFFSNVNGVIDPLELRRDDDTDSMEVDVDFLNPIAIGPGQFILAHTLEYIKMPAGLAAQVEGRSSFARLGLQVHMTANLVEAGFDGCLTLEIANCGHSTIKLYPGMRIAQLRFFRLVTPPETPYAAMSGNKYRGLLSHNKTQQFSDWEVSAFGKAMNKPGYRRK